MEHTTTIVGLDVHKKNIVAGILPPDSERVSETVTIENDPKQIKKLVKRVGKKGPVEFVYEAGPCGYPIQRQLKEMGYGCAVIAPGLTPIRPGDRVKTDRRDAEKLARLYRAGELTPIRIPTREQEAGRDLVRVREDTLTDRLRARHRLSKFLLRQGRVYGQKRAWGVMHRKWLKSQKFEWSPLQQSFEAYVRSMEEAEERLRSMDQLIQDLAQQEPYATPVSYFRCLKGIDTLSAITVTVETQEFRRFGNAPQFMSYTGLVGSEFSSGQKKRRGSITKAGNAHIRRILVEAAWCYRYRNVAGAALIQRRKGCPAEVIRVAKRAQDRLHRKFWRMIKRNKPSQVTAVAVARELAGFIWSIGQLCPARAP